ncbi:hypothetical protein Anas_01389, partial [Armadillidium nasatum]
VVTQLEAVDAGVTEINKWLNEAEGLLDNFSLQGSKETIQGQLDKHRVFFSRQLYFKSMLETKNRIYQSLLKTSNGGEYLDMVCLQEEIKQVNERFEEILSTASKWENKMADSIRHWESFIDCEGEVVEWLQSAEKIFQEKTITSKSTLEMQKDFFIDAPEHLLQKVVSSGEELLKYVEEAQKKEIQSAISNIRSRWGDVLNYAPLHLLK